MQEWCACGASLKGSRRDVTRWRTGHNCTGNVTLEPDKSGAEASVERAEPRRHEHGERSTTHDFPIVYARMGFTPND